MARLIHPSYFPATRAIGEAGCSYYLNLPLVQGMEAYWRVKKWYLQLYLQWANDWPEPPGYLSLQINRIIDLSAPDNPNEFNKPITSEDQLVCGQGSTWFPAVTGLGAQGSSFQKSSGGFLWIAEGFEFVSFEWPESRDPEGIVPISITLTIGEYSTIIRGGVANQPDTVGFGSVQAVEWWPYEDANGKALYDITTGQPL